MTHEAAPVQSKRAIFIAALDIVDAQKQREFLDSACQGDPQVRIEIERLLAAHYSDASHPVERVLEQLMPVQKAACLAETQMALPDGYLALDIANHPAIGPYKLLEQIGEGGMGSVFMAQQAEPIRRKVALKIIRTGMASKEIVARFEAERQALALMDHPNIARVIDGGTTPAGQPFFAMELVQGVPITEYADAYRMSIPERLEMFVKVCQAVQHAHLKGVIHRDLKPSNILVSSIDDRAVPKVIDFGLAKAIGQPLTETTLHTGFSRMMGTPMYMSPEQAEMGVIDVDTRCDVYALGVVLYELLVGDPPLSRDTLKAASFDEVRRIIREVEPKRPSFAISTLAAEKQTTIADHRRIEFRKLRDSVHGELDWIVMKALEKDRNRRYESASALAQDIQRYLDDEPVAACPPSVRYQLKKLFWRHKGPVLAASVLGLGLILTTVLSILLAVRGQKLASYEREIGKRRQGIQEGINSALAEVARLRGESGAEGLSSDTLAQASEQIQRAQALAGMDTADAKSLDYIRQLTADLEQERRDRKFSSAMDAAWLAKAVTNPSESTFDNEKMIQLIRDALTAYGLPIGHVSPDEVGLQIASRSPAIGERLLAAFEQWRDALIPPVGVKLHLDDGRVVIRSVSSSLRESFKPGDQLVGVGQTRAGPIVDVRSMSLTEISRLLQGAPGSSVRLEVISFSQSTARVHLVQRDVTADWLRAVVNASDSDTWRIRVRDAYELDDPVQQRPELEKLANEADLERQPVNVLIRLAERLWELKAEECVLALLRGLQQRKPSDLWVNHSLGYHLEHSSLPQYEEAIRYYSVAVALRPDSAGLHLNLGRAFQKSGNLDAALAEFGEAARLLPEYAAAHRNLGSILLRLGKRVEGIQELREAVRLAPDNCPMSLQLAQELQGMLRLDEAVDVCRACLRLNDSDALHFQLGSALIEQQKFEEGIPELREFVRRAPTNSLAHFELGRALVNHGELLDEAIAEFRQAQVHFFPVQDIVHQGLATALQKQGKLDEAVVEYREVLRLVPGLPQPRINLSNILRHQGKLDEAVTVRREGLQYYKTSSPKPLLALYDDLGDMLMELSRWDEAAEAYLGELDAEFAMLNGNSTAVPDARFLGLRPKLVEACVNTNQLDALPKFLREELAEWQQLASVHTDKSGCQVQMFDIQHRLARWLLDTGQSNLAEEHFFASRALFEQLKVDQKRLLNTVAIYLKAQRNALPVIRAEMGLEQLALRDLVVQNLEPLLAISRSKVEESPKSSDAWEQWSLIAMTHYRERNWVGAEREAELAVKLADAGPSKMLNIVPFFLLAGKHDAYREVCDSIMHSYERWSGNDLANAATICLLDPQSPLDPQRLLRLVQRTVDTGPESKRRYLTEANIRVGGQPQAIEDLLSRAAPTTDAAQIQPKWCLWLAIAYHQVGRSDEARSWLEKAQKACETWDSPFSQGRMIVQVLLQEVESKLAVESDTTPCASSNFKIGTELYL